MTAPRPSLGLAVLLTTLVALGPLSTDMYLPALPTLAKVYATDAARVQLTLSVFLAGFACGQLFYGPLSDRFGRRPILLGGLFLYFIASIVCVLAGSVETLIVARFVQALGACAGPVLGRAIVRDVWGANESARIIAYIGGAMAIAPLVGPTLGGFLTVIFGWQANFAALALFSGIQCIAVARMLVESNVHRDPYATTLRVMAGNFGTLLADRRYVGYLLTFSFSYSALFAFISGSSFVLTERFGLAPQIYGMSFGIVVAGYLLGSVISGRLVRRFGNVGTRPEWYPRRACRSRGDPRADVFLHAGHRAGHAQRHRPRAGAVSGNGRVGVGADGLLPDEHRRAGRHRRRAWSVRRRRGIVGSGGDLRRAVAFVVSGFYPLAREPAGFAGRVITSRRSSDSANASRKLLPAGAASACRANVPVRACSSRSAPA